MATTVTGSPRPGSPPTGRTRRRSGHEPRAAIWSVSSTVPPFDYFGEERDRGAFRVVAADTVTTDDGTGLVHMAPAYGEADFLTLQAAGLDVLVDPIDARGRFTEAVPEVAGLNIKEADPILDRAVEGTWPAVSQRSDPPLLPLLLSDRHPSHVQGDSQLVREGRGHQGPAGRPQRTQSTGFPITSGSGDSGTGWKAPGTGPFLATATGVPASRSGNARTVIRSCIGSIDELADEAGSA